MNDDQTPEQNPEETSVPTPDETLTPEAIATLRQERDSLSIEITELKESFNLLVKDNLRDLERRKQALTLSVEQLERRQERIKTEMQSTFAGQSQEVAVRVQSFKDYLVGSLQDLALAAEKLELVQTVTPTIDYQPVTMAKNLDDQPADLSQVQLAEASYKDKADQIRQVLEIFRSEPDYYGPPWKLRRTFEKAPSDAVESWFFQQGGRGSIRTLGSRLQNILISSAVISILYNLYGSKLRPMILVNGPERLGEWRRGLQDCLGVTRNDFGGDRGLLLFEYADPIVQRADRLQKEGNLPLIIIDETEELINLSLLQYPLWLAFVPNPQSMNNPNSGSNYGSNSGSNPGQGYSYFS
jgi:Protein of unknown function (DUF3086)